jgi:hypothetical protein
MLISTAKSLAKQYGMKLIEGELYSLDLFGMDGKWIDALDQTQIEYLEEQDYIDFYLNDGEDQEYDMSLGGWDDPAFAPTEEDADTYQTCDMGLGNCHNPAFDVVSECRSDWKD